MIHIQEQTWIRDYVLIQRLSETDMGQVWKAQDLQHNRVVAIKMLKDDLVDDPGFRSRFLDETARQSRLEHPHIVPVYDFFSEDNLLCLVMRYIDGQSLSQLLASQRGKPLPLPRTLRISEDILAALDYAHRNGIIHRDVKPSNILLDRENNAHLIDFGISLAFGDIRKTRSGVGVGTPLYMSPEQIRTPRQVDQRSDVYSFGCVLYEMTTGRPPFEADEDTDPDFAIRQAHLQQTPVRPRQLNPELPAPVEGAILQALKKKADDRIPGCSEFWRLLKEAGDRPEPRFPWKLAGGIVAALAILAGLLIFLKPDIQEPIRILTPKPAPGKPITVQVNARRASRISFQPEQPILRLANGLYVLQSGFQADTDVSVVASNLFGSVTKQFHVSVQALPKPLISVFSPSATVITQGGTVTLRWQVSNARTVTLNGSKVGASGFESFQPAQTTSYTLEATGDGGTDSRTVGVVVNAFVPKPVIGMFDAAPRTTVPGGTVQFRWSVSNANTVSLNGEKVGLVGSKAIQPPKLGTYTYTLTATGAGGTQSQTVSITVNSAQPPLQFTRLQLKNGLRYLDACGANVSVAAMSIQKGGACQEWFVGDQGAGGWFRIRAKVGGLLLGACSGQVALTGPSGGDCQLWRFVSAGGGDWYRLQLKQGGRFLDASYCGPTLDMNPGSTYDGGSCQLWRVVKLAP